MSSAKEVNAAVDRARDALCRQITRMLTMGALTIRARIMQGNGKPIEACFYARRNRRWEMQPEKIVDPKFAEATQVTLEMLASKGRHDVWSAKQHATAGYRDTDIRFHGDELQHRLDSKLESELRGVLFGDRHDSKKDVRRSSHRRRK